LSVSKTGSSRKVVSEGAILVGLDLKRPGRASAQDTRERSAADSLEELGTLAESAGAEVIARVLQSRDAPEAATLIGSGKVTELAEQAEALGASVVLFDRDLTPTQLRNLEKALPCKVIDRTQLILDIFARRARTREGQLQVELAQLDYLLPRLTGRGVEMSRQAGGIGTRGPGETQLESDRRKIAQRVKKLRDQLESVRSHRGIQRRQRQSVPLATVALAGYTNAGKSTLFNRLTGAGVLADSKMFATLDPTVRQIALASRRRALLSDTVGFIANLPTTLVKAFRATLEEVGEAALILHAVDGSSPYAADQTAQVIRVLADIGAAATPQLLVLTKADRWEALRGGPDDPVHRILAEFGLAGTAPPRWVGVSALTGDGLVELARAIDEMLPEDRLQMLWFQFSHADSSHRSMLHEYARVETERWTADGCLVKAEISESLLRRLERYRIPAPE
jgi:GTP-binding protein HflX